jgi:3-deoxy-manno-octulosonate cytidylyltransferase (CMP-KDO synthetase)
VIAVIPARYASTRFPGKLLCPLHGKTLLARVIARARAVRGLDGIWVATDDERIAGEARRAGAEAMLTSAAHPSGTDRVGELVAALEPAPDFLVNLQGDEPLFAPSAIERLIEAMRARPDAIWTLADPIADPEEFLRPSAVKVVLAPDGRALYFSRAPIPFWRDAGAAPASAESAPGAPAGPPWQPAGIPATPLRHAGVYGYPRALLEGFLRAPRGRLEATEQLEQLRALEAGIPIRVLVGAWPDAGVDTPEDLERLLRRYPTPESLEAAGRASP